VNVLQDQLTNLTKFMPKQSISDFTQLFKTHTGCEWVEANWNDPFATSSKGDHRHCPVQQQKMPALIYTSGYTIMMQISKDKTMDV
jgi:hypothetical protein